MIELISVKTSELSGQALDWAVASALNVNPLFGVVFPAVKLGESFTDAVLDGRVKPTTDWGQCGVLIDEYGIEFKWLSDTVIEAYSYTMIENRAWGYNHREAVCRLIAMELGETVRVPSILVK